MNAPETVGFARFAVLFLLMGSFSELVLSFNFRRDTPDVVLAAFARLATEHERAALPDPVVEPQPGWMPDPGYSTVVDAFADEPFRHDWADWLGDSMDAGVTPAAALTRTDAGGWSLLCRCSFKSAGEEVFAFIRWIGAFIEPRYLYRPTLVGYIHSENDDRPFLLWARDGELVSEHLATA